MKLEDRAVHRAPGGEVWLDHATAVAFLNACAAEGLDGPTVIGIEAFEYGPDFVKPRMDLIWQVNPNEQRGPWQDFKKQTLEWAQTFLKQHVPKHLAVTFVPYSFAAWRRDSGEKAVLAFRAWLVANGFESVDHRVGSGFEREILRRRNTLFDLNQEYGEFWQIAISTVGLCNSQFGQTYLGPESLRESWPNLPSVERKGDYWQNAADWFKANLTFLETAFTTTPLKNVTRGLHEHRPIDPVPCPNRAAFP